MASKKPIKFVSKQEEKELLSIGEELFRTEFPNPERSGCPGGETLRTLVFRSQKLPLTERNRYFDHMTCCSPCFSEFSALVDQARYRKRIVVVGICALLLVTIGLATWLGLGHWRSTPGESITHKPPSAGRPEPEKKLQQENPQKPNRKEQSTEMAGQQPKPKIYQDVILDVRDQTLTRGQKTVPPKGKYPKIPRGLLNLSIYLPFASEAGEYQVRIFKGPDKFLLDTMGMAKIQKSITILEVKVDTTKMSPGRYLLETRRSGLTSGYKYTFLVAE
jgi:hypothetical protein